MTANTMYYQSCDCVVQASGCYNMEVSLFTIFLAPSPFLIAGRKEMLEGRKRQLVKSLFCKHKDPSLIPRVCVKKKKPGMMAHDGYLRPEEV